MMNSIEQIREASQYLSTLLSKPQNQFWINSGSKFLRRYPLTGLYTELRKDASEAGSLKALLITFREFKQRHFLRIAARDLLGRADLLETTSQLSDLAGVALQVGIEILTASPEWWLEEADLKEWASVQESTRYTIMGLGKFGGQELNYVSDIDLLVMRDTVESIFPENGITLLNRFFQSLFRLLSDHTGGDRVFEVDLRLRPMGKDGPLAPSVAAAAEYYLMDGRAWERQMLLKARPVAGDRSLGTSFLQEVRPFVFRRFLDFQAIDELRSMRDKITAESTRAGSAGAPFDVKLGTGGIREVEFLVQSLQLIYGGRHPELDEPNTIRCLEKLKILGLMPEKTVSDLLDSYSFLRRTEHWIQLDQNRQTQKLPQSPEALVRLARALGFAGDDSEMLSELKRHCSRVHEHFASLFKQDPGTPKTDRQKTEDCESDALDGFQAETLAKLRSHLSGFPPRVEETALSVLRGFCQAEASVRQTAALRLERYFGQVRKRPGLIKLFQSSPEWIERFCISAARSELVSSLLNQNPSLVEGITAASEVCPPVAEWERRSEALLTRVEDYSESLEWLRRLKNERLLQIAISDILESPPAAELEEKLSALAEFFIRGTYQRVRTKSRIPEDVALSILALGKLGSREMTYQSDLDLVFVYRLSSSDQGEQIPEHVIRLAQRLMRMLSTPLQEGPGYPVDARLRPTGTYGPLIVSDASWKSYYTSEADIWEIQALLRCRAVAGSRELGGWIEQQARRICMGRRDPSAVWPRICHLRSRMELERAEEGPEKVDLKLGPGGLTDIEFLVQGLLLEKGAELNLSPNSPVRELLTSVLGWLPPDVNSAGALCAAFEELRFLERRLRLHVGTSTSSLTIEQFRAMTQSRLWSVGSAGGSIETWQDLLRVRRQVRAVFRVVCPEP